MKTSTITLPIRTLSSVRSLNPQWICRRCLATKAKEEPRASPVPPPGNTAHSLSTALKQSRIPVAYLQHSTSDLLPQNEKEQREKTVPHKPMIGVVVSSGKMDKTVKVRIAGQIWNRRIGKYFRNHTDHLVHDPNSSLVTGDVVSLHRLRVSRTVGYVVAAIVSPFGTPIEARPRIPTPDERLAAYKAKRSVKLTRRELRVAAANGSAEAIDQLKEEALKTGQHAVPNIQGPGKVNKLARHNKGKAQKLSVQAGSRLSEAKEKAEDLKSASLSSDSALR